MKLKLSVPPSSTVKNMSLPYVTEMTLNFDLSSRSMILFNFLYSYVFEYTDNFHIKKVTLNLVFEAEVKLIAYFC